MASYNKVLLMGNLTRDPETRYLPSGMAVSEFGLAVNDRVKKGDEWVDRATFVDITVFGRQAETAGEYLKKGSPAFVEGRLQLDTWESKEGEKRSKLKVVAENVKFLGTGAGRGPGSAEGGAPAGEAPARRSAPPPSAPRTASPAPAPSAPPPQDDEDLPF